MRTLIEYNSYPSKNINKAPYSAFDFSFLIGVFNAQDAFPAVTPGNKVCKERCP
jgi:hypothetical protein